MFAAVMCVMVLCAISAPKAFGNRSLRSSSAGNWHLETGYLVDDAGPPYLLENAGTGGVPVQMFVSGRFYRFGPMAIAHRWQSRVGVTNVLALPIPKTLL
jgi:hypothetical protein